MTTYKQTSRFYEPGFGWVTDVFVVSDAYEGLTQLLEAIEVGCFEIESTKEDLDLDAGVFVEDEISFKCDMRTIRTADDQAALDMVLEANDRETLRFCARLVNPSDSPLPEEFLFRGRIRTDMSADDVKWRGGLYSGTINPVRAWSFSATSIDAGHILDADLKELVHGETVEGSEELVGGIDDAWIEAHVQDRMGYLYVDEPEFPVIGQHGHREARWGNLVSYHDIIQKLLEQAAPDGFTISYESVGTGLQCRPARYIPAPTPDGHARYCNRLVGGNPMPYQVITDDTLELQLGGSVGVPGSLYISWRLLAPTKEEEGASWLRYKTLAELLYAVGACFGSYVEFDYVSNSEIIVRYRSRASLGSAETFLLSATKAALSVKALSVTDGKKRRWVGAGTELIAEGPDRQYNYDGGFKVTRPVDRAPESGEKLALSLNPAWCFLENRGKDGGYDFGSKQGGSMIPHNVRFWKTIDGTLQIEEQFLAEKDRATLHSAIYVRTTGRADDGSVGVTGIPVWAPLHSITARRPAGPWGGTIISSYDRLGDYVNDILATDQSFYDNEYSITVPGLNGFRATADGPASWRNLKRGNKIMLDGVAWVVVGIERKRRETDIRLHNASRFNLQSDAADPAPAVVGPTTSILSAADTNVVERECGEAIGQFDSVTLKADGLLYKARARHEHYGRIIGVALTAGAVGQRIPVQTAGRIVTDDTFAYDAGTKLFVRTEGVGTRNIRDAALTAKTLTEDLYAEIGTVDAGGAIIVAVGLQAVHYPSLEDE